MKLMSDEINEVAAALAVAQGQMAPAKLDGEVNFNKVHFKYATLGSVWESIRKPLSDNGLSLTQIPIEEGGRFKLVSLLLHTSGQYIGNEIYLNANGSMKDLGGELTYARRYGANALLGVVGDEDRDMELLPNEQPANGQKPAPAMKDGKPILDPRQAYSDRLRALQAEIDKLEGDNVSRPLDEQWLANAPLEELKDKGLELKGLIEHWEHIQTETEHGEPVDAETEDSIPF